MARVDPAVLKRLRTNKRWSQEELAANTKINKQTISRLERGAQGETRSRTIEQLARVFIVAPAVLTGDSAIAEVERERDPAPPRNKLNVTVSEAMRNALYLTSRRYNVPSSYIVELAPFLFCWAAEASLRERRQRIEQVERACEAVRTLEREVRHLPVSDGADLKEKIAAEYESIDRQDLFGLYLYVEAGFTDPFDARDEEAEFSLYNGAENPFALFLRGLAEQLGELATFEAFESFDFPEYRVLPQDAALLVGGDSDLAEEILCGNVVLNDMPRELDPWGNGKERAEWVRAKAAEYRNELSARDAPATTSKGAPR